MSDTMVTSLVLGLGFVFASIVYGLGHAWCAVFGLDPWGDFPHTEVCEAPRKKFKLPKTRLQPRFEFAQDEEPPAKPSSKGAAKPAKPRPATKQASAPAVVVKPKQLQPAKVLQTQTPAQTPRANNPDKKFDLEGVDLPKNLTTADSNQLLT